jgi:hypothetical protein
MRWILKQTPDMPAGTAELTCDHGDLDPDSVELCVSQPRASGGYLHLDPRDSEHPWGTQEFWQRPVAAGRDGDRVRLRLDAFTTFHIGANKPYILHLRDAAGPRDGVPLLGIAMRLPSAPPKGWRAAEAPVVPPAPIPEPEPEPADEPEPEPDEETAVAGLTVDPDERRAARETRGFPTAAVAAGLVLLVLAGAAGWWFYGRQGAGEPTPAEAAAPAAPARTLDAARAALAATPSPADARDAGEAHLAARDLEGGFLLLRYAADKGDTRAALAVGALYDPASWSAETSPLPAPNAEQAAQWYHRAAEAGDPEAQYRLAMVLRSGRTEAADGPEQAVAWLRKAADQGHAQAKEALGQ